MNGYISATHLERSTNPTIYHRLSTTVTWSYSEIIRPPETTLWVSSHLPNCCSFKRIPGVQPMKTKLTAVVLAPMLISISCDEGRLPLGTTQIASPDSVTVFISQDSLPTIDWQPRVPVSKVVVHSAVGDIAWFLSAEDNVIEPPLNFAEVPPGVVEIRPANIGNIYVSADPIPARAPYVGLARTESEGDRLIAAGSRYMLSGGTHGMLFQCLVNVVPSLEIFWFSAVRLIPRGAWVDIEDPDELAAVLNIRPARVDDLVRNAGGEQELKQYTMLVADVPSEDGPRTVIWGWP